MKKGLLLGAGFSFDLGMPLAVEVTEVFLSMFDEARIRQLADFLSSRQPYGKDRPINEKAIRAGMDLLLKFINDGGTNYEHFLSQLETMPWSSTSDQDSRNFLFSVFYDILYDILVAYQLVSYDVLYASNRPWHSELGNLLSVDETWVFTLNHDVYLECLAIDLGIPITYGSVGETSFPISNLNLSDQIHFTCCTRAELSLDGKGWLSGCRGINMVRLHGGFCELEYEDKALICNPSLRWSSSVDLIQEFKRIESMGYYTNGRRFPSTRDRVITGPDGSLDVIRRCVLTGGNKYSKTMKFKDGEEKMRLFADVLKTLDELTIIGYGFGDLHVNYRLSNAMVLNESLKLRIVDPVLRKNPEFLEQFNYDLRLRGGGCRAAEWMSFAGDEKWNDAQSKALKDNEVLRSTIKSRVIATRPK